MKNILLANFLLAVIYGAATNSFLPGQVENHQISVAAFGDMRLFFYMTPEKKELTRQFVANVTNEIKFGVFTKTPNFPCSLIIPLAALYPDPIDYDVEGRAMYLDQKGMEILLSHSKNMKKIVENTLGITFKGIAQDMNTVLNFDAHQFHQDNFVTQYEFIKEQSLPCDAYCLAQDLTVSDWEMSPGTFSSTVLQDPNSEDRFIFPFFPGEIASSFFVEPTKCIKKNQILQYPGHVTMPPHSVVAPIDWDGETTFGSSKGKRISFVLRGIITKEETDSLYRKSTPLPVNRPSYTGKKAVYPNGLICYEHPKKHIFSIDAHLAIYKGDLQNIEIYESSVLMNEQTLEDLAAMCHIDRSLRCKRVIHLFKRDSGFTQISPSQLEISPSDTVIILNQSKVRKSHQHFHLAQDFRKNRLPWIQLYHLPPHRAMVASGALLKELCLTPVEEIFYRDAHEDINNSAVNILKPKFVTEICLIICGH